MKALVIAIWAFLSAPVSAIPDWAQGIASGEERLRMKNGSSILYRRISQTCEKATKLIEQDIIREFSNLVPHKMEHVYEDKETSTCAVLISVDSFKRVQSPGATGHAFVIEKANKAKLNAFTGMSYEDFTALIKDKSEMKRTDETGICYEKFESTNLTIHGTVVVCWIQNLIAGYCDLVTDECESKTP